MAEDSNGPIRTFDAVVHSPATVYMPRKVRHRDDINLVTISLDDLVWFAFLVRFIGLALPSISNPVLTTIQLSDSQQREVRAGTRDFRSTPPTPPFMTSGSVQDQPKAFQRNGAGFALDLTCWRGAFVGARLEEDGEVFVGGLSKTRRTDKDELRFLLKGRNVAKDVEYIFCGAQ
jgi:hypothetical protein